MSTSLTTASAMQTQFQTLLLHQLQGGRTSSSAANRAVQLPTVKAEIETVEILRVPKPGKQAFITTPEDEHKYRIKFAACLLSVPPIELGRYALPWLLSLILAISPGFSEVLFTNQTMIKANYFDLSNDMLGKLTGQSAEKKSLMVKISDLDAEQRELFKEEIGALGDNEMINVVSHSLDDEDPSTDQSMFPLAVKDSKVWDDRMISPVQIDRIISWEITAAVGILLYGLNKPATQVNYRGFSENRTRAIQSFLGAVKLEGGALSEGMFPSVETLNIVKGIINLRQGLRVAICTELVAWAEAPNPDQTQRVIGLFIQLWKGSGFTHVANIRKLLAAYPHGIEAIPALLSEAVKFMRELTDVEKLQDPLTPYRKAIDGDRCKLFFSKDYEELVKISTALARVSNPTMSNYASTMQLSIYQDDFDTACKALGVAFPDLKANARNL